MKSKEEIKSLAEQIASLEKELQLGNNIQENQNQIENIMSALSLEEMLELDDFIMTSGMLKK